MYSYRNFCPLSVRFVAAACCAVIISACGGGSEGGSDANYFAVRGATNKGAYQVCMDGGPFFNLDIAAQQQQAQVIARNIQRYYGFVGGITYNTGSQADCAYQYPSANRVITYDFYKQSIQR